MILSKRLLVLLLLQGAIYATLTFENKLEKPVLVRFETGKAGQVSVSPPGQTFEKIEIAAARPEVSAMERLVKPGGSIKVPNYKNPEKILFNGMQFDPRGHAYGQTCTITVGPQIRGSSLFEVSCEGMSLDEAVQIQNASLIPFITDKEIYEKLELANTDDPMPYEVLNIKKDAKKDEIEKAYKQLAEKWDPEKQQKGDEKDVVKKILAKITQAYEELTS